MIYHSIFFLNNSSFYQNYGENGGALRLIQYEISIINSNFIENAASISGGALYISSQSTNITKSQFMRNLGKYGGAIYFYNQLVPNTKEEKNILVFNSLFYFNVGIEAGCIYTFGMMGGFRSNYIKVYFFKNMGLIAAVFRIQEQQGIYYFKKCEFLSNLAEDGSGFYIGSNPVLELHDSKFIANAAIAVLSYVMNIIQIIKSFFVNISNYPLYTPIITVDNELSLWLFDFKPNAENRKTQFNIGVFVQESTSHIHFNFGLFKRNTALDRGSISLIISLGQLIDNNSKFIENHSGGFGGVFDIEDKSNISLRNSIFFKNSAESSYILIIILIKFDKYLYRGSVIYAYYHVFVNISNITAQNNGFCLTVNKKNQGINIFIIKKD